MNDFEEQTVKYDYPDMGCYVDESHGSAQTLNERIVEFAEAYGWEHDSPGVEDDFDAWNDEADGAVMYLNGCEDRLGMYWTVEDNSLFLLVDAEDAKERTLEDGGFVSSREREYPADDYRGEWIHVNDHGNVTLYIRRDGEGGDDSCRDEEVWSVV